MSWMNRKDELDLVVLWYWSRKGACAGFGCFLVLEQVSGQKGHLIWIWLFRGAGTGRAPELDLIVL